MKKLLSISLVLLCMLSIAGCSQKEASGNKPESTVETTPETTAETKPEEPAVSFSRGSWDAAGKVFVNEITGIRIQLGEGYAAISDAELASLYLGEDVDLSSWTEEDYKTQINIPECHFNNTGNSGVTAITYENLAAENAAMIDEDTYLAIVLKNLSGQRADLNASDVYDLTLSGQPYRAYDLKYSETGLSIEQTMAVRKVGDYMTIIVFSRLAGKGDIPEMISFFD